MDDLLYVTIPRPDKQIVQCAPCTKYVLARRHVRIVAELRLRFQWKAMDLLESKSDLMYVVDNPEKKRFKLFSHEICQIGKFPQYKWSEPNPVEIVKRSNHSFRILYYVKTGELWSDDGLIGNWNKKCEDDLEEKRLTQIMKNTNMLIKKFDEKGFLTTTVKNAEELFMSKREFMND
jgi:hypothetical protein